MSNEKGKDSFLPPIQSNGLRIAFWAGDRLKGTPDTNRCRKVVWWGMAAVGGPVSNDHTRVANKSLQRTGNVHAALGN
jgi:hypothetical protein